MAASQPIRKTSGGCDAELLVHAAATPTPTATGDVTAVWKNEDRYFIAYLITERCVHCADLDFVA